MQEKIKSMEVVESGYLQLHLTSKNDVDEYMLKLIQESELALSCIQDKRAKTKFLYDIKGSISLHTYFGLWKFNKVSAYAFLEHLFAQLSVLDESLPLLLQCDAIYVDAENCYKMVVLPIHEHYNVHNDIGVFLQEIMNIIQIEDDYEVLGYLFHIQNRNVKSLKEVRDALREMMNKPRFISPLVLYHRKEVNQNREDENAVRRDREIGRLALLQEANNDVIASPRPKKRLETKPKGDTVVLFSQKLKQAYIEDQNAHRYAIEEEILLGRSKICDVVINDATISSKHASIRKSAKGYEIEDLNSSNQTMLNGVALVPNEGYPLHHLDVIMLATFELHFFEEKDG